MTGTFGISDKADEQHITVGTIWRLGVKLVAPQPKRPPGAQLARGQADNIGVCSGLRDELKVMQPDFRERQVSRNHVRPTF